MQKKYLRLIAECHWQSAPSVGQNKSLSPCLLLLRHFVYPRNWKSDKNLINKCLLFSGRKQHITQTICVCIYIQHVCETVHAHTLCMYIICGDQHLQVSFLTTTPACLSLIIPKKRHVVLSLLLKRTHTDRWMKSSREGCYLIIKHPKSDFD